MINSVRLLKLDTRRCKENWNKQKRILGISSGKLNNTLSGHSFLIAFEIFCNSVNYK